MVLDTEGTSSATIPDMKGKECPRLLVRHTKYSKKPKDTLRSDVFGFSCHKMSSVSFCLSCGFGTVLKIVFFCCGNHQCNVAQPVHATSHTGDTDDT